MSNYVDEFLDEIAENALTLEDLWCRILFEGET